MQNNNESNIRFSDLVYLFVSRLWLMILVAVIVGGSIFAYNYLTYKPMYSSTASMLVLKDSAKEEYPDYNNDLNVANAFVDECKAMLKSQKTLDRVIEKNGLDYSYEELVGMISVENATEAKLLLTITVTTDNASKSQMIADSVCEQGEIVINEQVGYRLISSYDNGNLENTPCNSRYSVTFILGALAAFILTYIVIVLIYIFDDRISDPDLAEKYLDLPVLALIPNMKDEKMANGMYKGKTATKRHRYYAQSWKERR